MKKTYESAEMTLIKIAKNDIIVISPALDDNELPIV